MKDYLKKADIIAPNPSERIHFGEFNDHKTVTGGICSLLVISCFVIVGSIQAYDIWIGKHSALN